MLKCKNLILGLNTKRFLTLKNILLFVVNGEFPNLKEERKTKIILVYTPNNYLTTALLFLELPERF